MRELIEATEQMRLLDNNYEFIMSFINQPDKHFTVVEQILNTAIAKHASMNESFLDLMNKRVEIMNLLYDRWWSNTYPVHDSHFHKTFQEYCNCPFTCMTEIVDCLDKITKGA